MAIDWVYNDGVDLKIERVHNGWVVNVNYVEGNETHVFTTYSELSTYIKKYYEEFV